MIRVTDTAARCKVETFLLLRGTQYLVLPGRGTFPRITKGFAKWNSGMPLTYRFDWTEFPDTTIVVQPQTLGAPCWQLLHGFTIGVSLAAM